MKPLEQTRGSCKSCAHRKDAECRRYPPVVVVAEDDGGISQPLTVYPLVDPDEDGCGEHSGCN